jgi:hypothetical protein
VFTYCTGGIPHAQYYFKRPGLMVAGSVTPPRIDLTNEDLVRSHVQAIWLAESGLKLGTSLKDLLDLSGDPPKLDCLDFVQDALNAQSTRSKAKLKARAALSDIESDLQQTDWWHEDWLDIVLAQIDLEFNKACGRWRDLYRAAKQQQKVQHGSSTMPVDLHKTDSRPSACARKRKVNWICWRKQKISSSPISIPIAILRGEGFLPGYSFPRLPLSAYNPARRIKSQDDEFLSGHVFWQSPSLDRVQLSIM